MNLDQIFDSLILLLLMTLIVVFFYFAKAVLHLMLQLNKNSTEALSRNFRSLHKNIQDSVQSKFIELSPSTESIVELAIEVWRLEKRVEKANDNLTDDQNKAFSNSLSKLHRFLDKNDIAVQDYTNHKYNDGLNLDVLSIEKDPTIAESIIKETHEPAVIQKGQIIKKAKVVVLEK
jgi:hypothetical protein